MARFSRVEVINEVLASGLVPLFDHPNLDVSKGVVEACLEGGVRVIEFRNRGDYAFRVFSDLATWVAETLPSVMLGVGSVMDGATAALYLASGANFVVSPIFSEEVARLCNRRKVAYMPGCGSVTEISQAEELGVEICKIFPGDVGGPSFVKAVLAPCPWSRLMPTGGVQESEEGVGAWINAGAACLGMGSNLVTVDALESLDYATITANVGRVLTWIRSARAGA